MTMGSMSPRGKHTGQGQWCLGAQGYTDTRVDCLREPRRRHDHRRGDRAVPGHPRAGQGRAGLRRPQSRRLHPHALMRVLFDNGTLRGVAAALQGHTVDEVRSHGWDTLRNWRAARRGRSGRVRRVVTTDRHIRYQQNLTGRKIAIVVLGKGRWRLIRSGSPLSARAALLKSGRKAFDRELRVLAKDLSLHGAGCGQFQAGTDANRLRPVPHARPCRPARLDQRR